MRYLEKLYIAFLILVFTNISCTQEKDYFSEGDKAFNEANFQKAIEYYSKGLETKPEDFDAYFNRGKAFFNLDK